MGTAIQCICNVPMLNNYYYIHVHVHCEYELYTCLADYHINCIVINNF